jgi:hypothetical protein
MDPNSKQSANRMAETFAELEVSQAFASLWERSKRIGRWLGAMMKSGDWS